MVWAAPAPAAIALCLRVSTNLVKAAVGFRLLWLLLEHKHTKNSLFFTGLTQAQREPPPSSFISSQAEAEHGQHNSSPTGCPSEPITATTIATKPILLDYTPEEFNLCLSNDVLMENLEALLDQTPVVEYYEVMKEKVDEVYPSGIPEKLLRRLGPLARRYSEEEISQWSVTSSDTLAALLDPSGGDWDDSQVQQLLSRYLTLGGTLTGPLLQAIKGRRLCNLREEQMEQIPAQAIGTAGQLDISACSQAKKELLYRKAREAFADLAGTPSAYFCRLRPYLGGAPAEDLKNLANAGVAIDMDMDTFLSLNPKELQKLSVMDVKNLLGKNLPELKKAENEPLVMGWVERQFQRELDRVLGIGLQGGMKEPTGTTTPAASTTTAGVTSTATSPVPTTLPTVPTCPCPTTPDIVTPTATVPTPPHPTTPASATSTGAVPVPTTLPTVPTPVATTTPPTTQSSTVPLQTPTPSALSSTPLNNTPPSTESPPVTSTATSSATPTAHPALTTTSIAPPCSTHQSPTTNKATPSPVPLLPTTLVPVSPNTTSPSSVPVPAVTSRATTSTSVGTDPAGTTHSTSSPLVPMNTPVPGGTTHPAPATHSTVIPGTHSATSTPVPNPTSAPTAIHTTPTPIPSSTISTQESIISSTPETTTAPCPTSAPPGFPSPSSTTTSSEATKPTPGAVPESPRPTSHGHINLQPKPDSGPRLSSCLIHMLAVTVGTLLLQGLL
ncbi:endochitinase A-like [Neopelma chrysocephalum]|uniref:endochitinase A-like n=1 Tax=Neopelma chrysocephalum TaxID=114329 RepID=UPI000FCCF49F|nr:endochitinase A-like [Neopelma chrysocephalum]